MADQRIVIVFDTKEGQTRAIAERIAARAKAAGYEPGMFEASAPPATLSGAAGAIIGGSIHVGKHGKHLVKFAKDYREQLEQIRSAFFSVSMAAARTDEEHQATAQRMASDFEGQTGWHSEQSACFAGALPYTKYNFFVRFLMKRISKSEGGDTDTSRDYVYTRWDEVDAFTDALLERVAART
ncbi:MAG: flavodoxin domain-containing protein [Dehalococcoidia bacterium]